MDNLRNIDIYDQNYNLFKKYYPDWILAIDNANSNFFYEVIVSRSGELSLKVNKNNEIIYYHSTYRPMDEARKILNIQVSDNTKLLVIAGLAFGYLPELALQLFDFDVIVWDFDFFLLKTLMYSKFLGDLLTNKKFKLIFSDNPQVLIDVLKTYNTKDFSLIVHKPSEKIYQSEYDRFKKAIYYFQSSSNMNNATLKRFERIWTRNILRNSYDFLSCKGVNSIFGIFEGIPCVIVAAGPSLMKNIHLLKSFKGKAVIIAVDTILQVLQFYGVEPDFVIAVDPQDINKKYFENLKNYKAILVVEPSVSPKILREYKGRKLILGSVFHFVSWMELITGKKGVIDIGGSVATAAYGLALELKLDPIIFVGLDLAYSYNQTHIRGSYFEENWIYSWDRFSNNYALSYKLLKKSALFEAEGYNGGVVLTDQKFDIFKKWFEAKFRKNDKVNVFNASEGGVRIAYCKEITLKDALHLFCFRNLYDKTIRVLESIDTEIENDLFLRNYIHRVSELIDRLSKLNLQVSYAYRISKDLYSLTLRRIRKDSQVLVDRANKIHAQLDRVDFLIRENDMINAIVSSTMQSTISRITDEDSFDFNQIEKRYLELRNIKKSILLYDSICESIDFNIKQLNKSFLNISSLCSD